MAAGTNATVTLMAGGDVGPSGEPVDSVAELILPVLQQADIRFAPCERLYSNRGGADFETAVGEHQLGSGGQSARLPAKMASIWKTANIDVISLAGNHAMELGPEPLMDTVELLQGMGKHTIGVGKNIDEARKPAIVERNGIKIAFLGYCTVLRKGEEAGKNKVGIAPMRAHSFNVQEDWQPGTPPKVISTPHVEDLRALQEDIRKAKKLADAVVMSIHWGIHHIPKTIADYQPYVAHAAIDAGADLILGHHAHCIKAVETYRGKVCFYSLGNFMTMTPRNLPVPSSRQKVWDMFWYQIDPEYQPPKGKYPHPTTSYMTMVAKAVFSKKGVEKVSFLPAYINSQAQPAVLQPSDPKFKQVVDFTEWSSDQFPHKFKVEGNEVVIDTSAPE